MKIIADGDRERQRRLDLAQLPKESASLAAPRRRRSRRRPRRSRTAAAGRRPTSSQRPFVGVLLRPVEPLSARSCVLISELHAASPRAAADQALSSRYRTWVPSVEPFPLRDDGVLGVLRRGLPGLEDPEPGASRPGHQRRSGEHGDASGCGRPAARPAAPADGEHLAGRISRPALPWCSGSAVIPIDRSIRCSAASSTTAPPTASRRAGPAWATGAPIMPSPPEAAAADAAEDERQLLVAPRARTGSRCRRAAPRCTPPPAAR